MQEMQETQVWSLGQEDPQEEEMITCSSILAWKIPWTEEPGKLQSMGSQRDTTEQLGPVLSTGIGTPNRVVWSSQGEYISQSENLN